MAEIELYEALANCLDRMTAGESLEDCLAAYPQHAARLRDLLKTANLVYAAQQYPGAEVTGEQNRGRDQVLLALGERRTRQPQRGRRTNWFVVLSAAAVVTLVAGAVLVLSMANRSGTPSAVALTSTSIVAMNATTSGLLSATQTMEMAASLTAVMPSSPTPKATITTTPTVTTTATSLPAPSMTPAGLAEVTMTPRSTAALGPVEVLPTSVALMSPVPHTPLPTEPSGGEFEATPAPSATPLPAIFSTAVMPTAGLLQPALTATALSPLLVPPTPTPIPVLPTAEMLMVTVSPQPMLPTPTPGEVIPLNAGEINDNLRWDNYLLYRRNFLQQYAGLVHEVDVTGRQLIVVSDIQGLPVLGARVQVYAGQMLVSETLTDASGQTLLFPNARPETRSAQSFRVIVSQGNTAGVFALDPNQGAAWNVTLPATNQLSRTQLDVLFLLDTTGSMGDELAQLQNNIVGISSQVNALAGGVDVRYGLVTYRDRGDLYVSRVYDFTPDVGAFQSSLSAEYADGGGDEPESVNEALHNALHNVSWRGDNTIKLVFLVADAPPHLDYANDFDYAQEMVFAAQRGIKIHPIASSSLSPVGEYIFRQLAQYTLGHFIFLTYQEGTTSGAPGEARPDLAVGTPANPETGQQGDYTVERLDELVLQLITDELAALKTPVAKIGIVAPVTPFPAGNLPLDPSAGAYVPPTPTPSFGAIVPNLDNTLAAADAFPLLAQLSQIGIGLPVAVVLVGIGLYIGYVIRPRERHKRKNDYRYDE